MISREAGPAPRAFAVRVPVMRDGSPRYVLSASVSTRAVADLFGRESLPASWRGSLVDGRGDIFARSPGTPAAGESAAFRPDASARPRLADWRVVLAAPAAGLGRPWRPRAGHARGRRPRGPAPVDPPRRPRGPADHRLAQRGRRRGRGPRAPAAAGAPQGAGGGPRAGLARSRDRRPGPRERGARGTREPGPALGHRGPGHRGHRPGRPGRALRPGEPTLRRAGRARVRRADRAPLRGGPAPRRSRPRLRRPRDLTMEAPERVTETRYRAPDGSTRWVDASLSLVRGAIIPGAVTIVALDATERARRPGRAGSAARPRAGRPAGGGGREPGQGRVPRRALPRAAHAAARPAALGRRPARRARGPSGARARRRHDRPQRDPPGAARRRPARRLPHRLRHAPARVRARGRCAPIVEAAAEPARAAALQHGASP